MASRRRSIHPAGVERSGALRQQGWQKAVVCARPSGLWIAEAVDDDETVVDASFEVQKLRLMHAYSAAADVHKLPRLRPAVHSSWRCRLVCMPAVLPKTIQAKRRSVIIRSDVPNTLPE